MICPDLMSYASYILSCLMKPGVKFKITGIGLGYGALCSDLLQTLGHGHFVLSHHEGDDQSGRAGLPGEAKMKVKLPMNEDFAFILESFHYKLSAFLKGVFDIFARRVQEIYAFISEVLCVNGAYLGVCGLDLASRC